MTASIASQDFRDGAALGAREMADRLTRMQSWGVVLTPRIVWAAAESIQSEYGGRLTTSESSGSGSGDA